MSHNLYQQNTELELMELLIPFLMNQSFLDIGAEQGEFTRFFSHHGLKGVFFEPLPQRAAELTVLAKETECTYSQYAIDSYNHTADFYCAFDQADIDTQHFSSLHPLQNDRRIRHKKICTVECKSLNSLLEEGFIPQTIGIIKIDTEGNDLNIMKGMDKISPEILMCEFFMPDLYSGWEMGHPEVLIQQANQLGFNHFCAIKRMDDYEFVSLDHDHFVDKQWGNLIFLSDKIYKAAEQQVTSYLHKKEDIRSAIFLKKIEELQKICDERLIVIDNLAKIRDKCFSEKIKKRLPKRVLESVQALKKQML